jgi:methyl-accepting chemotaxis protein
MVKDLKLGIKLNAAFLGIAALAAGLGALAIYNMLQVKAKSVALAQAEIPEVAAANQVERTSLHTMFEMRGFVYTEDKAFLQKAETNLAHVKEALKQASEHADKYDRATLRQHAKEASERVAAYERLVAESVKITASLNNDKAEMNGAATEFVQTTDAFLASENKQLDEDLSALIGEKITEAKFKERLKKIELGNLVTEIGNTIRIGAWKGIANRDPEIFRDAIKSFPKLDALLDQAKAITVKEADLKLIADCRAAAHTYQQGMEQFLANWTARENLNKQRNEVADQVLALAEETAKSGMDSATGNAQHGASALATASNVMIGGSIVCVVLAVSLGLLITRMITRPVGHLVEGLGKIALGDLSARVSVESKDEIGQLSAAANTMAEALDAKAKLSLQIADGDLRHDVSLLSDKDTLGLALR